METKNAYTAYSVDAPLLVNNSENSRNTSAQVKAIVLVGLFATIAICGTIAYYGNTSPIL